MITSAIAVAALSAAGIYLALQRGMMRILIGFLLLQHAANLLVIAVRAGDHGKPPVLPVAAPVMADPLGQAFALTAIVVGLSSVAIWLALAYRVSRQREQESAESEEGGATGDDEDSSP